MRTPAIWALPESPVTAQMLNDRGISTDMIATQVRSGRLLRLRRGVYLAAECWPEEPAARHLMLGCAEQVANPGAVLSHQSAAVYWGLPFPGFGAWHDQPVAVVHAAGGTQRARVNGATHHEALLEHEDLALRRDGGAVTSIARTATDLAVGLNLPEALVILDAAARRLVETFVSEPRRVDFSNSRLARTARGELERSAQRRLMARVRPAIALVNPARESPAESLSAGHFHVAGLPAPQFQARIVTAKGTFFPDCLWEDARYRFVRWLAKEIMLEPHVVVARVGRALGL